MSVCTFFGHRDCYGLDAGVLKGAIEKLIRQGADTFYVGHQGQFDAMVLHALEQLKEQYPRIRYCVVLAYLPTAKKEYDSYADCGMYPEGLETVPPRFAVDRRNRWMLQKADICLCYVSHTWGGAYPYARIAKRRGKTVVNLGTTQL